MRVNLGSGDTYLEGWVNVDPLPTTRADVSMDAFDFVREHGPEVEDLYMGHFIEHLLPATAIALLRLIAERVPPGSQVSAVVPDMRAIFAAYDHGDITNDELNERFVYSYEQPSHHVWCYDVESLKQIFEAAGFLDIEEIDPLTWEPVWWKEGPEARWQCGVRATVPEKHGTVDAKSHHSAPLRADPTRPRPVLTDEVLLARIAQLRSRVEELESGTPSDAAEPTLFDRLPPQLVPVARRALPSGSRQRRLARFAIDATRATRSHFEALRSEYARTGFHTARVRSYGLWRTKNRASPAALRAQRALSRRTTAPLRIECVVLHDGRGELHRTLSSLQEQSWGHWHATVVGPEDSHHAPLRGDDRIAWLSASPEGSLKDANAAIARSAWGDFVLFLSSGDWFAPDAMFEITQAARRNPLLDLVYWDDDLVAGRRRTRDPEFRPSWSPETLLSANYLGRSFAVRRQRYVGVAGGGLKPELGDAAWWDLLLRAELDSTRVGRIPRVLAHVGRRPVPDEQSAGRVLDQHVARHELQARVPAEGALRIEWTRDVWPLVTVVVPTRHNRGMVASLLGGLAATDYPELEIVIIDNGERTTDNERWYAETFVGLPLRVAWWADPFNYSAVNNEAASLARGEVLVFLNDDIELPDPSWLRELVGWAMEPEIGLVGAQLIGPDGEIQHGGVILGMNGFADHLFQGMPPGSDSLLGSTSWYRNVLSVTGACMAVRRELFEALGGFNEQFDLCGSDVALGLDAVLAGKRNVCTPFARVVHLESATRGSHVPPRDFFTSYWRYQHWLTAGDPYFSPNLSIESREPKLRSPHELSAIERAADQIGRQHRVFRMSNDASEATLLADLFRVTDADARSVEALHAANVGELQVRTVNWFLPEIDSPFYGGVNTALRLADCLARHHDIENRFVFWAQPNELFFRSAIAAAFPGLAESELAFHDASRGALEHVPEADVAIATLWATAYSVAQFPGARRKFYMIQDLEPIFYPAGTSYALAEESYRLGLYGLCNTEHMREIYAQRYGGHGMSFQPAVDTEVFHTNGRTFDRALDDIATVFVYARPGHWRNCWELASIALNELKERLGSRVRIVTAGSWARPNDLSGIEHLGLLDYRATGALYRSCDVGVALTVSEHPSYLPLELMACGVPVVAFDNPAGYWLLEHGRNAMLARRTVDGLRDAIERVVLDPELGRSLSREGLRDVADRHASWDEAFGGIYGYLCNPESAQS